MINEQRPVSILSVNIGYPATYDWDGKKVATAIFKQPVEGSVAIRKLNLNGDQQADLKVHGGPNKAVYLYAAEHYTFWRTDLQDHDIPFAAFGENITTSGLLETDICIGDQLRVGTSVLTVTQPRTPCYKLNLRFDRHDMIDRFHASQRSGIYCAVHTEGVVAVGDTMAIVDRNRYQVSVASIIDLGSRKVSTEDTQLLERALKISELPEGLRKRLNARLISLKN